MWKLKGGEGNVNVEIVVYYWRAHHFETNYEVELQASTVVSPKIAFKLGNCANQTSTRGKIQAKLVDRSLM